VNAGVVSGEREIGRAPGRGPDEGSVDAADGVDRRRARPRVEAPAMDEAGGRFDLTIHVRRDLRLGSREVPDPHLVQASREGKGQGSRRVSCNAQHDPNK
jgi:hypothetical protein